MIKNVRWLLAVCLFAIAGVIVLQFYWINNYYKTSLFNFEREANLAFEDAIKKDFILRCDTIEQLLVQQLADTSVYAINSQYSPANKSMVHHINNKKNKKDQTSFSDSDLSDSLRVGDTAYRRKIAQRYAHNLRKEDLEKHVVFYSIQALGDFTLENVKKYGFDTNRLRPILQMHLEQRSIFSKFHFRLTNSDSLFNYKKQTDSLANSKFIFTKAHPTYKWWAKDYSYVSTVFENPNGYIFAKMKWIFCGSLCLIVLVGLCIWLLLKALFHEKKLAAIKNDFISNITHELKTPVSTISAALEVLQDYDLNEEKKLRYLGHARNETNKLGKLINSILNISLYSNNKLVVNPVKLHIEQSIKNIVEKLTIAANKPVEFNYTNTTNVALIDVDVQLFEQAIANIIDNAIKYSNEHASISIACSVNSGYFTIQCTDNGEGISIAAMPYIFEKFYREPKPNHAVKGYGLGLNYVREILRAHNGKVVVTSIKGKGTTVILSWPITI